MRGHIYNKKIKERAKKLRAKGKTYKEIGNLLNVPKSTLSTWFGKKWPGIFNKKAQIIHLAKIRPLAIAAKKKIKEREQRVLREKTCKEIKSYPLSHIGLLKSMLAMLYWAEGSRRGSVSGLRFTNTDPDLTHLYITLLRKCYETDETKFRIRLHLHYYHKIRKVRKFWSELLAIPENQFGSIFIKKRSRKKRFRKNFMGNKKPRKVKK